MWVVALLGLMSLILSTVAVNYTALGSCLEHWDKPLAGDTLKECWTHGLPSALDRAQLGKLDSCSNRFGFLMLTATSM